jgi:hypothetical protein
LEILLSKDIKKIPVSPNKKIHVPTSNNFFEFEFIIIECRPILFLNTQTFILDSNIMSSYQPQTFENFGNIVPTENLKNGMCTIAAFMQGYYKSENIRITASGLRSKISDAMAFMVENVIQVILYRF